MSRNAANLYKSSRINADSGILQSKRTWSGQVAQRIQFKKDSSMQAKTFLLGKKFRKNQS